MQGYDFCSAVVNFLHSGDQIPKTHLWVYIGSFKPNAKNIETCTLSKLLHQFKPTFGEKTPSTHRMWSKYVPNTFKMADGHH